MKRREQTFVTARAYHSGRVLAVAHDGVLAEVDRSKGFLKRAFQWLTGPHGAHSILVSIGHCEWFPTRSPQSTLPELLEEWKYTVKDVPAMIDDAQLKDGGVLVIGNAWGNLADTEIKAIEKFVSNGGGLLVAGLGWSWKAYGAKDGYVCNGQAQGQDVNDLSTYPMNRAVEPYKMQWIEKAIDK